MAAFRERDFACDGMGHANRPRVHHAFGLDAQSRGLRLSFADRRHSHSNANTYGDTNSDSYCHRNSNTNTQADSDAKACSDTEAAPFAATAAITRS